MLKIYPIANFIISNRTSLKAPIASDGSYCFDIIIRYRRKTSSYYTFRISEADRGFEYSEK